MVETQPPHVLLIEADPEVLRWQERALGGLATLHSASSVEDGLTIAARERPQVAIVSLSKPTRAAVATLRRLRAEHPSLATLAVTSDDDVGPILDALGDGLAGILRKPPHPDELCAAVARLLADARVRQELERHVAQLEDDNERLRRGNAQLGQATQLLEAAERELQRNTQALQDAYRQLAELATRDELTQVQNRRGFVRTLGLEFERSRRYGRPASLVVVDVLGLHAINEAHGQAVGDQVLRDVALSLTHLVRANDQVFRVGGDEFAVMLPESDVTAAQRVTEKLRSASTASVPGDPSTTVPLSVGCQVLTAEVGSPDAWFALADADLHRHKGSVT